jgi:hypothetical protein
MKTIADERTRRIHKEIDEIIAYRVPILLEKMLEDIRIKQEERKKRQPQLRLIKGGRSLL